MVLDGVLAGDASVLLNVLWRRSAFAEDIDYFFLSGGESLLFGTHLRL